MAETEGHSLEVNAVLQTPHAPVHLPPSVRSFASSNDIAARARILRNQRKHTLSDLFSRASGSQGCAVRRSR